MKKISLLTALLLSSSLTFGFDLGGALQQQIGDAVKTNMPATKTAPVAATTPKSSANLSSDTITSGLKEALKSGVNYGVTELSKKGGYLNNSNVKIPLPENLAKAESLARTLGGDKIADDLIVSMNNAATKAAPKTAKIFTDAVDAMSVEDAKRILGGKENAATEYFQKKTTASLQKMIKPIIKESMQENNVAKHYDTFNEFYSSHAKDLVEDNSIMEMAKGFGADEYLPSSSDENLDDYVTQQAIDGLFKMIATKEAEIRKDPVAQTTSLLKQVFGN
ncbi:MAG: DUF4197 domain-containing protein [Sulfurimonas sp.]|nr:DUF4197 domain-containing protein [Sulfurimonas sp.]